MTTVIWCAMHFRDISQISDVFKIYLRKNAIKFKFIDSFLINFFFYLQVFLFIFVC